MISASALNCCLDHASSFRFCIAVWLLLQQTSFVVLKHMIVNSQLLLFFCVVLETISRASILVCSLGMRLRSYLSNASQIFFFKMYFETFKMHIF